MAPHVQLAGAAAELMGHNTWGLSTRACAPALPPSAPVCAWEERFVLSLPAALSEQLVRPAPGDNPFEGRPLALEFEVAAPTGGGGLGKQLARGTLPVGFDWMVAQVRVGRGRRYRGRNGGGSGGAHACML